MRVVTGGRSAGADEFLDKLQEVLNHSVVENRLQAFVHALRQSFSHYMWVGVYLARGEELVLAAYDGEAETQHIAIPIGQGMCGSAAKLGMTISVPDVSKDPRYLMCFPSSRAEIVVPITGRKGVIGEIDINSDKLAAFTHADEEFLERAASCLVPFLERPATGRKSGL